VSAVRTHNRRRPCAAGFAFGSRRAAAAVAVLWFSAEAASAAGLPAPAGATACSGCHGASPAASVGPPIAGRPAADLTSAMEDFRTGARPATVMQRIAKGFTPEESRAIAEWWAAAKPEAKP
jgi:cytochrome subunit of sulfide dehydrogenase